MRQRKQEKNCKSSHSSSSISFLGTLLKATSIPSLSPSHLNVTVDKVEENDERVKTSTKLSMSWFSIFGAIGSSRCDPIPKRLKQGSQKGGNKHPKEEILIHGIVRHI